MAITFGTLQIETAPTVYEPAEDSFLLATYASSLAGRILDVGTGTGITALAAANANEINEVIGVDINPVAVACAKKNAQANKLKNCDFFVSDIFSGVSGKFDTILFNPPYLPTTREERLALSQENAAYDGGQSGLEVFYRFSGDVAAFVSPGSKVAVIATSLSKGIEQTLSELELRVGPAQVLATEEFFFEKIVLIEAVKQ